MTSRFEIKTLPLVGAFVCAACGGALAGGDLHLADFAVRFDGGQIDVGVVTGPSTVEFPFLVKSGAFGDGGIPDFTGDPGWISPGLGTFSPGTEIGFDIVAAAREWDGLDFEGISDDTITVRKFLQNFETPPTDQIVPGIVFGEADPDGLFHHHVQFLLNFSGGPAEPDGVWLLQFELWTTTPGIERSDTLFIVFAQGAGLAEQDDAVAWVETNLLGGPGCNGADLAEPFGTLDFSDVLAFLGAFGAGEGSADLAEPFGVFDFSDVIEFLSAFGAGCP